MSDAISFTFDGRRLVARAGDTLATALLRNGIRHVSRSFRYHRPRGVYALGADEPNAWVNVDGTPTVRATQITATEGLDVRGQNVWPSLRFDVGRFVGAATAWLPPGFYYKTFKWPHYRFYEGAIRRQAGLGVVPAGADKTPHVHRRMRVDVLVIGGGASGRAAARAQVGRHVLLVDEQTAAPIAGVEILSSTTAVAVYDDKLVLLVQRSATAAQCLWWVRAEAIVLATGAAERPLLFANNDRPGIMLASAAACFHDHGVNLGRVAVFTNNTGGVDVAARLVRDGANVVALIDYRADAAAHAGCPNHCDFEVKDTRGRRRLTHIVVGPVGGRAEIELECDTLCVAGGWSPRLQLYAQAGGRFAFDAAKQCFVPDPNTMPVDFSIVGRAAGASLPAVREMIVPIGRTVFVDLAYDVTTADIDIAVREGFDAPELVKRFTTAGMAPDQGKTSNINAVLTLAQIRGVSPAVVGTTTLRPPYEPVSVGALAGSFVGTLARPIRRLPLHEWHVAHGAELEVYAGWWRSAVYLQPGESETSVIEREVVHTRSRVSVLDSSSLTKILVAGPDAAEFLHRVYANSVRNLQPGHVRYGLMLNDEGIVKDDGVLACLGVDRYLVSASSAGGGAMYLAMDRLLQTEWRNLRVVLELVTTQWCTLCVCGAQAPLVIRALLPELSTDVPHMSVQETHLNGAPVLLMAVSFTGERSFEISIRAGLAASLSESIHRAGAPYGVAPLGLEALDVLRLEKGYFEVGVDTDVDTGPMDIGWAKALQQKRGDFIGKRSLPLPVFNDARRKQLVGLASAAVLPVGAVIVGAGGELQGHVTSSAWSPTLLRPVALGLLADGRARLHESLVVAGEGRRETANVVDPRFYDPANARLQ